ELADIHLIYGESRGNAREAVRRYQGRFPDRRLPSVKMFLNIHRRLRETGKLLPDRRERGSQRPDRILNTEEVVLDAVYENPSICIRRLSGRFDVSLWTIWRTLHEQLLYPYHVQRVQALRPTDFVPRRAFCEW
ncbi:hypothetical protein BDFB_014725, partial [Asbolus verrucosus]